jgi:hypothetical protein
MAYSDPYGLQLDPAELPFEPLNLQVTAEPEADTLPIPPEIAGIRAFKAKTGGTLAERTTEDVYNSIMSGQEDALRNEAAARIDHKKSIAREDMITKIMKDLRAKNIPVDRDILQKIRDMVSEQGYDTVTDPSMVFEEHYSNEYFKSLKARGATVGSVIEEAEKEAPKDLEAVFKAGTSIKTRQEYINTQLENVQVELNLQSTFGWLVDQAKMLSQIYQEVKLRSLAETGFFSQFGLGNSLDEQAKNLFTMPVTQFKATIDGVTEKLKQDNPTLAMFWLQSMNKMSNSDVFLNNVFSGLALTGAVTIGKVAKGLAARSAAITEAKVAAKDMLKAGDTITDPKVAAAEGSGDAARSAVLTSSKRVFNSSQGKSNPTKEAVEDLQGHLRTDAANMIADEGVGVLGREVANRIAERIGVFGEKLMGVVSNVMKVDRIPGILASEKAVKIIQEGIKTDYKGSTVLEISKPIRNRVTNTYSVDVAIVDSTGELFTSGEKAKNYAEFIRLAPSRYEAVITDIGPGRKYLGAGYTVEQAGAGFYIKVNRNLDETSDIIRDMLIETKETKSPDSKLDKYFGWLTKFRTPDEVLSEVARENRKVATYTPSVVMKLFKEEAEDIKNIAPKLLPFTTKSKMWKEWKRAVEHSKQAVDPNTNQPGYFFQNLVDLEHFYQNSFKRNPTESEAKAYFSFVRLVEADRILREVAVYRNKARLGAEQFNLRLIDEKGGIEYSPSFEGVLRKSMPGGDQVSTVLVTDTHRGVEKLYTAGEIPTAELKELERRVKSGELRVVEIYDPELRPLKNFGTVGEARVRYVVSPSLESRPLNYNVIPRRGGGHFEYDYDFYIKQARVKPESVGGTFKHWYEGDTTIMPIMVRSMGIDVANKLDEVRKFLKDGRIDAAQEFAKKNLPIEWDKLHSWFKPSRDHMGQPVAPRLSLEEPIQVVEKDKFIVQTDNTLAQRYTGRKKDTGELASTFYDGTRQGSLARQHQVQFVGERDAHELFTFKDVGTRHNPLYESTPVKFIDPISSINRAITKITHSTFLDDYKIFSVEHWLREAARWLKPQGTGNIENEIRHSPFYYFNKGELLKDTPSEIADKLEASRFQINQLMGHKSTIDTWLHSTSQKLVDSLYGTIGPKALVLEPHIDKIKDPLGAIRAITFHAKLGLFNLPQLLVQLQTYSTILGVAGSRYAVPGAKAALLHRFVRANDVTLDKLDDMATKTIIPGMSKWKPGEFREAYQMMDRNGFGNVAGEYAMQDNTFNGKIINSTWGAILDAGTLFFREGERGIRHAAFYTAYREFRDKFPTGRITERAEKDILRRADDLSVNMSRASSSALHQGLLSIPSQFLSYQLRTMELFLGKRLTHTERARLLGTYMVMYGAPTSLGLTGFPFGDYIRKSAMEENIAGRPYVPGDDLLETTMMEGVPALILALITGQGSPRKGYWYNISDRYGVQGFELLREILRSDKGMWEIIGGAAFSTLKGAYEKSDGMWNAMISFIRDDGKHYPLKVEDFIDPLREISTINNAWRLWGAVNTLKWLSKKDEFLGNTTVANAIFMTATGLQTTDIADMHLLSQSIKDKKEGEKYAEKQFMQDFRRGLQALYDGNLEQHKKFMARSSALLKIVDYPQDKIPGLISQASKTYESLRERIDWSFFIADAPDKAREERAKSFRRKLELEQGRK